MSDQFRQGRKFSSLNESQPIFDDDYYGNMQTVPNDYVYSRRMNLHNADLFLAAMGSDNLYNRGSPVPQRSSPADKTNLSLNSSTSPGDKRFRGLPDSEVLPRSVLLGGYIFVCNNETMEENLKRKLFGLPQRYRDTVRAITPGLPLFLYNYSTHQLHGVFEAESFGGTNIDPTAWEDKKSPGESRFPAQVRARVRRRYKALEEEEFRPLLHHYDGPKFRLQLSVPEVVLLLDLFSSQAGVDSPPTDQEPLVTMDAPESPFHFD